MNALPFLTAPAPARSYTGPGLIIDNFAGGGGASTGIEAAMGRKVDIAINHDEAAIAVHAANHPDTEHYCQSVWAVDPLEVVKGRPVDLAWFSPDCKHFSKAKGGKPVEKNIRDLAWVVVHWATRLPEDLRPKVIMLENVEEFKDWGPLTETDKGLMPCRERKGQEFKRWIAALRKAGYRRIQWKELRACDFGAPTIRKRLFLIARRDGHSIVWPKPTHGDPKSPAVRAGKLKPWRTAAEIIDWSIPCPSIFGRDRPLKEATCRRIAAGILRYVVNAERPFIVPLTHHGNDDRLIDLAQPLPTVTGANRGEMALVQPYVVPITHTSNGGAGRSTADPLATITTAKGGEFALIAPHVMTMRNAQKPYQGADEPTHTITAGGAHQYLVAAFMAQHNSGFYEGEGRAVSEPISTITGRGTQQQLVTSNLIKLRGTCADGQPVTEPMPTLTAGGTHVGEVRAFLMKYYGDEHNRQTLEDPLHTVTTKDRFGLVTVSIDGEEYVITDIGMRMLALHELGAAQGFPAGYNFQPECEYVTESGNRKFGILPKSHGIAKVGNSVSPPIAEALVNANCGMYAAHPEKAVA